MKIVRNSWGEHEPHHLKKAQALLQPSVQRASGTWADLGCGEGIYTYLLTTMLHSGSEVFAVDKNRLALRTLTRNLGEGNRGVSIQTVHADFSQPLSLPPLDGLVMANSLHFVKKKRPVLAQLVKLLKPGGRLVVIEYNTDRGNYAVPHPLDEREFLFLAEAVGLRETRILIKVPSTFLGEQYTGMGLA
jgi:ubiquinone/menaquinone biosynthesis C-methylase UbiE